MAQACATIISALSALAVCVRVVCVTYLKHFELRKHLFKWYSPRVKHRYRKHTFACDQHQSGGRTIKFFFYVYLRVTRTCQSE